MNEIDPRNLRVLELGRDGILLRDERDGMHYAVVVAVLDGRVHFDLAPAWPAREAAQLRGALATVYDARGVEIWIRSARLRGWTIEQASEHAERLVDGAF